MGLYERSYMRAPRRTPPPPPVRLSERPSTAPWWSRFRFWLWLRLHPGKARSSAPHDAGDA